VSNLQYSTYKAYTTRRLTWCSIGNEIGVAPEVILETSHGRRSIDILKILAPEKANWECEYSTRVKQTNMHGGQQAQWRTETCRQTVILLNYDLAVIPAANLLARLAWPGLLYCTVRWLDRATADHFHRCT
jgi:hypothetical protein